MTNKIYFLFCSFISLFGFSVFAQKVETNFKNQILEDRFAQSEKTPPPTADSFDFYPENSSSFQKAPNKNLKTQRAENKPALSPAVPSSFIEGANDTVNPNLSPVFPQDNANPILSAGISPILQTQLLKVAENSLQQNTPAQNNPQIRPVSAIANEQPAQVKNFNQNVRPIKPAMQIYGSPNPASNPILINHGFAVIALKEEEVNLQKTTYRLKELANITASDEGLKRRLENFTVGQLELGQGEFFLEAKTLAEKLEGSFPKVKFQIQGTGANLSYRSLEITPKEQDLLIRNYLQENYPSYAQYKIEYFQSLESVFIPDQEPSFQIKVSGPKLGQSLFQNWQLSLYIQKALFKEVWIRGRLKAPEQTKKLEKIGEERSKTASLLKKEDLTKKESGGDFSVEKAFEPFFKKPEPKNPSTEENLALASKPPNLSKEAKENAIPTNFVFFDQNHRLFSGQAGAEKFDPNQKGSEFIVKKNNFLEVIYQGTSMELRMKGVALESGNVGDFIRVRNADSNKVFSARILTSTQVLVSD